MEEKDNLAIIQKALEDELLNSIIKTMESYDTKIKEIFLTIEELQEIMIMQLDEAKRMQDNFTGLEIDAKISKAIEEFENQMKANQKKQKNNDNSLIVYSSIAIFFLIIGLIIKG